MRVLLYGSSGFIGYNIALGLLADESIQTICPIRSPSSPRLLTLKHISESHNISARLKFVSHKDSFSSYALPAYEPDVVIYAVGLINPTSDPLEYQRINADIPLQVFAGIPVSSKFIYISTIDTVSEFASSHPSYIASKRKAETLLLRTQSFRLPQVTIVRPSTVFGPMMNTNRIFSCIFDSLVNSTPLSFSVDRILSPIGVDFLVKTILDNTMDITRSNSLELVNLTNSHLYTPNDLYSISCDLLQGNCSPERPQRMPAENFDEYLGFPSNTILQPYDDFLNSIHTAFSSFRVPWLTDTRARPVATERVSADWVGREP